MSHSLADVGAMPNKFCRTVATGTNVSVLPLADEMPHFPLDHPHSSTPTEISEPGWTFPFPRSTNVTAVAPEKTLCKSAAPLHW